MAADTFKFKRGTTAAVNSYLPAVGEPVYDITLKRFSIGDGVTLGGVTPSNSFTADKLTTARNITLTGSVTGLVSFDGSANVSMSTSVGTTLQASLDLKAPLASPALTGVPTAPTAVVGTNTTQLANMAALRAMMLGTVSQSGGIPTGALMERGSNANGEYVKYADGTMTCWSPVMTFAGPSNAVGAVFASVAQVWTYPVAFISLIPACSGSGTLSANSWLGFGQTSLTSVNCAVMFHSTNVTTSTVRLTAQGRWF